MGTGLKYDDLKPQFRLIPPYALEEIADVMTYGARKYAPDNWRNIEDIPSRYLDATLRHINTYQKGFILDDESNRHHLAHAVCCLMYILEKDLDPEFD